MDAPLFQRLTEIDAKSAWARWEMSAQARIFLRAGSIGSHGHLSVCTN
jgi:hypothetical protein